MKVVAKCWINCDGEWHPAGEVFETEEVDENTMTVCESPSAELPQETEVKRGRKRKTEE